MKKEFLIFSGVFVALTISAQKPWGSFYYLKQPIGDVFSISFMEPKENNDPVEAYNQSSPDFSDKEFVIANHYSAQTVNYSQNDSTAPVSPNSWNHVKGIEIKGYYRGIKHVVLNDSALLKIDAKDHFFHAIEGLKADSILFTIKKTENNDESIAAFQAITELFDSGPTVISKVLYAMQGDSTESLKGDLTAGVVYLKDSTPDSISFTLKDKGVYFAVRYIKIGDKEDLQSLFDIEKNPVCKPKTKAAAISCKPKLKGRKLDYNLLGDSDCRSNRKAILMHFEYDTLTKNGFVYIVYGKDTVYRSKPLGFSTSHYCTGSYRFLSTNIEEQTNGIIRNELIAFNYGFYFDSRSKEIKILSWDTNLKHYITCVYYQFADVTYYPR